MAHSANYLTVSVEIFHLYVKRVAGFFKKTLKKMDEAWRQHAFICYITPTIITGKFRSHLICFSILKETLLHCRAEALTENVNVINIDLNQGRYWIASITVLVICALNLRYSRVVI